MNFPSGAARHEMGVALDPVEKPFIIDIGLSKITNDSF
jgi:hypothetical protein